MGACCSQPSQPNDIGPLSDIRSDLDDGVVNGQLALCISQRVRCRDKGDAAWRTGTVTSTSPLKVQVDSWDSAHSWDQVEAVSGSIELKTPTTASANSAEAGSSSVAASFRVSQRVRCKDKCDATWRTGKVSSISPLRVNVDGWSSARSWEQVEAVSGGGVVESAAGATLEATGAKQFPEGGVGILWGPGLGGVIRLYGGGESQVLPPVFDLLLPKPPEVGDLEFALSKLAFLIEEKWGVPDGVEKFGYNMVFMPPTGPLPSASPCTNQSARPPSSPLTTD